MSQLNQNYLLVKKHYQLNLLKRKSIEEREIKEIIQVEDPLKNIHQEIILGLNQVMKNHQELLKKPKDKYHYSYLIV